MWAPWALRGMEGERALDGGERAIDLAGLDLGEGVRAGEPPVLAVGGGQRLEQRQQLGLAPGAAREADQAEHAGAGRQHHGVARIVAEMLLDGGEAGDAAAVDHGGERVDVAALAMRQARCQLARPRGGGLGLGRACAEPAACAPAPRGRRPGPRRRRWRGGTPPRRRGWRRARDRRRRRRRPAPRPRPW